MSEIKITEKRLPRPRNNLEDIKIPIIAWRGSFKRYLELVSPTTEAADSFHFATFLQVLGCTVGRLVHVYHATKLYPNFYTCLVGRSGLTRKDTCWSRASDILRRLFTSENDEQDEGSPPFRLVRGIRSYEGLLDELGGKRKIRLIQFGELLSLLAKAKQESLGNIIPQLTELYDCPDKINPPVRQETKDCIEPFLSIMAGTTQAWLQKALTERDIYGGFANRWLFFYGLPKDPIPNPPKVNSEQRQELLESINRIRLWARDVPNMGEIGIAPDAEDLFAEYYKEYYGRCQKEGLIPTLIVRIQDFVWKIALLYAVDEKSSTINKDHLTAAIAVGEYLENSVAEVFSTFGSTRGKQDETRLLEMLRSEGMPIPERDLYRRLSMSSKELDSIITPLIKMGLVAVNYQKTKRAAYRSKSYYAT